MNEELPLPHFFDVIHYDSLESKSLVQYIDEQGVVLFSHQFGMHGQSNETA